MNTLKRAKRLATLLINVLYDMIRFAKWSFAIFSAQTKHQVEAKIAMEYHAFEKGLALLEPRPGFGGEYLKNLINDIRHYECKFGIDNTIAISLNALTAYADFNEKHGMDCADLRKFLAQRKALCDTKHFRSEGGVKTIPRSEIHQNCVIDFERFCQYRYSVRQFSNENVDLSLIEKAILISVKTPSVCNRQSCRVHIFSTEAARQLVLRYQQGNKGFGHLSRCVLIVTSDLQCFAHIGERYQGWIDGGMFAMSLIYALHSLGLGTCPLNWSVEFRADQSLRAAANIPDNEVIIMMIAVGHLPETVTVAQSPRKTIADFTIVH